MLKRWLLVLVAGAGLAGCAQGPGASEITTGSILPSMPSLPQLPSARTLLPDFGTSSGPQRPERISGNLYRVHSGDRKVDDAVQRQNYALLRAAESAKEVGGTHFIVVDTPQGRPDVGTPNGQTPTSTMIRVLRLDTPSELPAGAISADEIIHFFGPSFGRSPEKQSG